MTTKQVQSMAGPRRFDRSSLRWRLPALFAVMSILPLGIFGILAYRAVRQDAIHATETRLASALAEIRTITELGVVNQLDFIRAAAADPAVVRALTAPAGAPEDAALAALRKLQGTAAATVVAEIIDARGVVRLSLPAQTVPVALPDFRLPGRAAISPLVVRDNSLVVETVAPVSEGGVTIGAVRVTRTTARGGANRRIAAGLLGPEVVLLSGNSDGTLFGDQGPQSYPAATGASPRLIRYARNGESWISASVSIRDTPWLYAMELPERVAVAPARALILPFLLIATVIAALSAWAGLLLGRRITGPLTDLTAAAESIAGGARNVRFAGLNRKDEVGRLAKSFETMAASVRAVVERLESEVDSRGVEMEEAVQRLQKLHEALQQNERLVTLGRLSGSVGHELRNPLGVMSNVVFLLNELADASPKVKDYARLLREQIRLSDRIISDLLDHARSGSPVCSAVDVVSLVTEVISRADVPAAIRVERRFGDVPARVWLDREQVTQILWNLISNAVQAMKGGPGSLVVGLTCDRHLLRIEVCDSGPGIAADARERVFQPMYTTKANGVGLGLSISRAFARANGGDLYVSDGTTVGACFVLEMPMVTLPAQDAQAKTAGAIPR